MRILAVVNNKGGVGKTTTSGHLGVQAELDGFGPVVFIDMDEQGSLSEWWNAREAQTPLYMHSTVQDLVQNLVKLKENGAKLVIIDTLPGKTADATAIIESVIAASDMVLIPTRPSPLDLRAIGPTIDKVEAAGKRMVFVLNGAANRASITGKAAVELSQYGTVAPVTLYQRTLFADSMADGRTAQEVEPEGKSAIEIKSLWQYVNKQLNIATNKHSNT